MLATFTLTVPESKRLIAKGIVESPKVKRAMEKNKIIVAGGTTNGYIVEELLGEELEKEYYTAGTINEGVACITDSDKRIKPITLEEGKQLNEDWLEFMEDFTAEDVFIKGANAFDNQAVAGVLAGDRKGGTIGRALGTLISRGSELIMPVGLEKRIDSVKQASELIGIDKVDYSLGMKTGLIPVTYGQIFTEIEALDLLTGVQARQVAAGGIADANGAVTLAIDGDEEKVVETVKLVKEIKGEPKLKQNKQSCNKCQSPCNRIKS